MSSWSWANFEDAKPHVCYTPLFEDLLHELVVERKHPLREPIEGKTNPIHNVTEASLDHGGGCFTDRPWEEFMIDGLKLSIPSEHLDDYAIAVNTASVRYFTSGAAYVKIHHYWGCLVMTPEQRDRLSPEMMERKDVATRRHAAFRERLFAERRLTRPS